MTSKQRQIDSLANRESRILHEGKYSDLQSLGYALEEQKNYAQQETKYSEYQDFLYKRAMFGLKVYSEEELAIMHWQKRQRIQKVHKRTQIEINAFKQSRFIKLTNQIFSLFTHSSMANELVELYSEPEPEVLCKMTFKELDITKEHIVDHLLEKGLLPFNFKTLANEAN